MEKEELQAALEEAECTIEQNAKSKALKAKKRLELDNTKKANNEAQKFIKQKLVDIALSCESASLLERHCAALAMELDEARALL